MASTRRCPRRLQTHYRTLNDTQEWRENPVLSSSQSEGYIVRNSEAPFGFHTSLEMTAAVEVGGWAQRAMRDRSYAHDTSIYEVPRQASPGATHHSSGSMHPDPSSSPSPSYLALACQAPETLSSPSSSRKLLILDLNGTLLFRSPHSIRSKGRSQADRGLELPRLRPVHPRPYMPAFRSYLFAPQTKAWLEVMIWSSAQPHSVSDMAHKCFGEKKDELLAVWARDTLGLSQDHYHRKVQTVKDLEKPWALFSPLLTPLPPSPHDSEASTSRPDVESNTGDDDRTIDDTSPRLHSALTTILLDDSPLKAILQPHNHICVSEYTAERRAHDLEGLQKEQEWELVRAARAQMPGFEDNVHKRLPSCHDDATNQQWGVEKASVDLPSPKKRRRGVKESDSERPLRESRPSCSPSPSNLSSSEPEDLVFGVSQKRSREHKRQKKLAMLAQRTDIAQPDHVYDEMLLAIIGVLDEIKCQNNVAAWIRSGGLRCPLAGHSRCASVQNTNSALSSVVEINTQHNEDPDGNNLPIVDRDAGNTRLPSFSDVPAKGTHRRHKKSHQPPTGSTSSSVSTDLSAETTVEITSSTSPLLSASDYPAASMQTPVSESLWFENAELLAYWAARGRTALEELNIPAVHGIDR